MRLIVLVVVIALMGLLSYLGTTFRWQKDTPEIIMFSILALGFVGVAIAGIGLVGFLLYQRFEGVFWAVGDWRRSRRSEAAKRVPDDIGRTIGQGNISAFEAMFRSDRDAGSKAFARQDDDGLTPVHVAAVNGHTAMIEAVAEAGLKVLYRNNKGQTFIDVAGEARQKELADAYARGYARCLTRVWTFTPAPEIATVIPEWIAERLTHRNDDTTASFVLPDDRADAATHFAALSDEAINRADYPRATALADAAITLVPAFAYAYSRRAASRFLLDKDERAIADLTEAIRLAPDTAYFVRFRGSCYYDTKRYAQAVADYEAAAKLDPGDEGLKTSLADAIAQRDASALDHSLKIRDAIIGGDVAYVKQTAREDSAAVWKAFMRDPSDPDGNTPDHLAAIKGDAAMVEALAWCGMAVVDRNHAGKTLFDVAAPENAPSVKAAFCRGFAEHLLSGAWRQPGVSVDARTAIEQWIAGMLEQRHAPTTAKLFAIEATQEGCAKYLGEEAAAAVRANEIDRAANLIEFALRLAPQSADYHALRGTARGAKGDPAGALADLNEALRLAPANAAHYEARGTVYEKMGNIEGATADYMKVLELDPSCTHAQERLNAIM